MRFFPIVVFLMLIACSSEPSLEEQGKILFNKTHLGKNKVIGCVACHSVVEGENLVGPSLSGLKKRAEQTIADISGKEYIRQSIINPDAFMVEGYLPGVMFSHYSSELNTKEINALIAYLSKL